MRLAIGGTNSGTVFLAILAESADKKTAIKSTRIHFSAQTLLLGTKLFKLILRDLVNLEVVSRQAGDFARVSQSRNWALVHCDSFRFSITFSAGLVIVLDSGVRVE